MNTPVALLPRLRSHRGDLSIMVIANAIQTVDETLDQYRRVAHDVGLLEINNERYLQKYRRMIPEMDGDRLEIIDALNHARTGASDAPFINEHNSCSLNGIYLYDFLNHHGFRDRVELIDNIDLEAERAAHVASKVDVAILSTTFITSASTIVRVCEDLRAINPDLKIIVGGAKLTQFSDDSEMHGAARSADALILSRDGEVTLLEVIRRLTTGAPLHGMANVAYDDGGFVCASRNQADGVDINEHSIRWDELPGSILRSSVNLRTGRGCPFKCKFCTFPSYNDQQMDLMKVQTVIAQLRQLQNIPSVTSLRFVDDTLFLSRRHLIETCIQMIEMGWDRPWTAYLRASTLSDECARLLAEAGCRLVLVGIESADQTVLDNMRKGTKEKHNWEAAANLRRHGIFCFAFIIVGFPGETEASVTRTITFLNESGVDGYVHSPLFVFPNSPLAREAEAFGLSGGFNDWSHDTMDCATAVDQCDRIFSEVRSAAYLDRGSSVAKVLLDHGLSVDRAREISILHNDLARATTSTEQASVRAAFNERAQWAVGSLDSIAQVTSPYRRPSKADNAGARY